MASAHGRLTPDERRGAAILVGNYGEAGAIDLFGGAHGLPRAISGHNNYWLWGPGGANGRVMVLLGGTREDHEQTFESVEEAGIVECTSSHASREWQARLHRPGREGVHG